MVGKTNVAGARLFAVIAVTYPEGSTCTCTNGTKMLTAPGTSGNALFNVPELGAWTVSITNGTLTASKTVSLTSEGQGVHVELLYDLVLYKNGVFSTEAGNWISLLRATINEYNEYFEIVRSSSDYANRSGFESAVDTTEYSSLEITCTRKGAGHGNVLKFGVTTSIMGSCTEMGSNYVGIPNPKNDSTWSDKDTYTLNVEAIDGAQYIGIDGKDFNVRVYSIVLKR